MTSILQYFAESMFLVLGAAIAGFVGVCLNYHREKYRERILRKQFSTFICDDLRRSESLYAEIAKYQDSGDVYNLECIDDFIASREVYEKQKDNLVLFVNKNIRENIYRYYRDSLIFFNQLTFLTNKRKSTKEIFDKREREFLTARGNQPLATAEIAERTRLAGIAEVERIDETLLEQMKNLEKHGLAAKNLLIEIERYV